MAISFHGILPVEKSIYNQQFATCSHRSSIDDEPELLLRLFTTCPSCRGTRTVTMRPTKKQKLTPPYRSCSFSLFLGQKKGRRNYNSISFRLQKLCSMKVKLTVSMPKSPQ